MKTSKTIFLLFFSVYVCLSFARISIPLEKRSSNITLRNPRNTKYSPFLEGPDPASTNTQFFFDINQTISNFQNTQYFGNIYVGSQRQTFSVVFDTGSDILWLPASGCDCHLSNQFNCGKSTTCSLSQTPDDRTYGTGSIAGYDATDFVSLNSDFKVSYDFILVETDSGLDTFGADGILGMNNDNSIKNFADLAYDAGYIGDKVFSFYFDNNPSDYETQGSYISIGFIPEQHVNNLIWLPATDSTYWSTDVIGMLVNGQNIDFGDDSDISDVLFDSGTSFILLAAPAYNVLVQELRSSGCFYSGSQYQCACGTSANLNAYPNVTFFTRGAQYTVTAEQYLINPQYVGDKKYCAVAVGTTNLPGGSVGMQILGDPFFRYNFIAFSKSNQTMGIEAQNMIALRPVPYDYNFWFGVVSVALMAAACILAHLRAQKPVQENKGRMLQDYYVRTQD